eukprot:scaffold2779_cov25-Prasinocladus_malaysianus.AAC.2
MISSRDMRTDKGSRASRAIRNVLKGSTEEDRSGLYIILALSFVVAEAVELKLLDLRACEGCMTTAKCSSPAWQAVGCRNGWDDSAMGN